MESGITAIFIIAILLIVLFGFYIISFYQPDPDPYDDTNLPKPATFPKTLVEELNKKIDTKDLNEPIPHDIPFRNKFIEEGIDKMSQLLFLYEEKEFTSVKGIGEKRAEKVARFVEEVVL